MSNKTHWKKYFNYDYLGTYSLEDGRDLILTIKNCKKEMVTGQGGKKEECFVCYFTDHNKPMILNRTNCKIIEKIHNTPHVEEWTGKRVQLYRKEGIQAFGQTTDGLRIREFKPDLSQQKKANELEGLTIKIRSLLTSYEGQDIEQIKSELNEAKDNGDFTVDFAKKVIKQLSK